MESILQKRSTYCSLVRKEYIFVTYTNQKLYLNVDLYLNLDALGIKSKEF